MPQLFRIGQYIFFFWSNENDEPIHVHMAIGSPSPNATKLWLTKSGGCVLAHNKSRISQKHLSEAMDVIQINHFMICNEWQKHFGAGEIKFYM